MPSKKSLESVLNKVILGDCLEILNELEENCIDLIYVDPPFFTQKTRKKRRRDNGVEATFRDSWPSLDAYLNWLWERLVACDRVLKADGSVFVHCDWHASHRIRTMLDDIFGYFNFRNEIIWSYKRWTLATAYLQRSHNNIYFYAKSEATKMNTLYEAYSPTTNLDQIWQKRSRDDQGKSIYAIEDGETVGLDKSKRGVPLRDVWDIPYLNPKAKERVGYPTQKPVELLERIVELGSNEGEVVLDPMVGSGTTLVAAKILGRSFIGIDISPEAVEISRERLTSLIVSRSDVVAKGRAAFEQKVNKANASLMYLLEILDAHPVYRSRNIDGFLRDSPIEKPVAVRIVGASEDSSQAFRTFLSALKKKQCGGGIFVESEEAMQPEIRLGQVGDSIPVVRTTVRDVERDATRVLIKLKEKVSTTISQPLP